MSLMVLARVAKTSVTALALTLLAASGEPPRTDSPSLSKPFQGPAACGTCNWCIGGHMAPATEQGDIAALHSWCMELAHCDGHPACGSRADKGSEDQDQTRLEINAQLARALEGTLTDLVGFALKYPEQVELDLSRRRLHVWGCEPGVVAASVPLPDELMVTLTSRRG